LVFFFIYQLISAATWLRFCGQWSVIQLISSQLANVHCWHICAYDNKWKSQTVGIQNSSNLFSSSIFWRHRSIL